MPTRQRWLPKQERRRSCRQSGPRDAARRGRGHCALASLALDARVIIEIHPNKPLLGAGAGRAPGDVGREPALASGGKTPGIRHADQGLFRPRWPESTRRLSKSDDERHRHSPFYVCQPIVLRAVCGLPPLKADGRAASGPRTRCGTGCAVAAWARPVDENPRAHPALSRTAS